ncbi:MAG: SIS domain-containing protein [Candidatus Sulfotelmatobacter sp.]|jgi:D-sedoheptulose 7-phosphate isomerase
MGTIASRRKIAEASPRLAPLPGVEFYLQTVSAVLNRLPFEQINQVTDVLWNAYRESRAAYLFGNGGSAALASHCACDFGKGTIINGNRRFRVLALTDNVPLMTAWANDARYDDIFAEQLRSFLQPDDVVFAISGSGNSPNVLNALAAAREIRAFTVGLTGFQGGKMKALCDLCVVVPSDNMQVIEDAHLSVTHSIFTSFRQRLCETIPDTPGHQGRH